MPARIKDEDRTLHYAETAPLEMARFIGDRYLAIVKRREKEAAKETDRHKQLPINELLIKELQK